jgi:Archaeal PaREP1/PaREP8 family.
MLTVTIPSKIAEELARRGIDAETYIIDLLSRDLGVDPEIAAEAHVELALKYLEEGRELIDGDPIQASEKLYKAAEEVVKALTMYYRLNDILDRVNKRGRWTVTELEKAVLGISKYLGDWFGTAWDRANYLHVWGFHEAKLDSEDVRARLPDIERMVREAQRLIQQ